MAKQTADNPHQVPCAANDQRLAAFKQRYDFTPNELKVLDVALTRSESIRELAQEMFMSERVFQRYLTKIYGKTGTKSRIDLILKYYTEPME